jgi:hypothetical protein
MNERLGIERDRFRVMDKRKNQGNTLDSMIKNREWVEEGLNGVVSMMEDSFGYFDSLLCLSRYQSITCHQYSWALGYALASLYVLSVNARIGCIEKLTMKDYAEMNKNKMCLATEFKTSRQFSYQIVLKTDIIDLFIKYIRKGVIPEDIDSDESVVFPTFKGSQLSQGEACKKIQHIFERYGYRLTVTSLRKMISTHLHESFHSQKITLEEYQTCVQSGQTHSMSTHKKYYAKKRKIEDGHVILNTYSKIFPQSAELSNVEDYYSQINHDISATESQLAASPAWSTPQSYSHPPHPPHPTTSQHQPQLHLTPLPAMSDSTFPESQLAASPAWSTPQSYSHPPHPPHPPHPTTSQHQPQLHLTPLPAMSDSTFPESQLTASYQIPSPPWSALQSYSHEFGHREFGLARSDLNVSRKKYDWIPEEISFLREYINNIEPTLGSQAVSKSRYALCLNYLKNSADVSILQHFHPHHVASSDRLKNGFLRALESKSSMID